MLRHLPLATLPFLLTACDSKSPATPPQAVTTAATEPATPPVFPTDWVGTWSGPATLHWPDGRTRRFTMSLAIVPTQDPARYTWTITYAEGEQKQVRPYELVVIDAAKGQYEIDEKNGIRLPTTLLAGALRSSFTVQGTQIISTDRLERAPTAAGANAGAGGAATDAGDTLISEMLSFDTTTPATTGGENGIPQVQTLRPTTLQRAVLSRTKPAAEPIKPPSNNQPAPAAK